MCKKNQRQPFSLHTQQGHRHTLRQGFHHQTANTLPAGHESHIGGLQNTGKKDETYKFLKIIPPQCA